MAFNANIPVDMIYLQLLCIIVLSNVFHVPLANWAMITSAYQVRGATPGRVKLCTASPMARNRCDVFSKLYRPGANPLRYIPPLAKCFDVVPQLGYNEDFWQWLVAITRDVRNSKTSDTSVYFHCTHLLTRKNCKFTNYNRVSIPNRNVVNLKQPQKVGKIACIVRTQWAHKVWPIHFIMTDFGPK